MLRFLTAGESHGQGLVGILEGLPWGLVIDSRDIDENLARRQKGHGRGMRMQIEKDKVEVISGLKKGKTIGSPIALLIKNKDCRIDMLDPLVCPRPGHADLAGALKYNTGDIRDILERASARETAMRVAIGAICRIFLREFNVEVVSYVNRIGSVCAQTEGMSFEQLSQGAGVSLVSCADKIAEGKMLAEIDRAAEAGDSLGGIFEVAAVNVPAGLGSYSQWDRRLDGRIAALLMSIPAVKGIEIGNGFLAASLRGSQVHDAIFHKKGRGFFRNTNMAGGMEGGMTNGQPLVLRCAMKPIATLRTPLPSVDIKSKRPVVAAVERADVCAVPAAAVVGEAVVAFCLAQAFLEKFGGDSIGETKRNYEGYIKQIRDF